MVVVEINVPLERGAPFEPASTNYVLDGTPVEVVDAISQRLAAVGFDYEFFPNIAKWRALKFSVEGDRSIEMAVRLYRTTRTDSQCLVECQRRYGDKTMFNDAFRAMRCVQAEPEEPEEPADDEIREKMNEIDPPILRHSESLPIYDGDTQVAFDETAHPYLKTQALCQLLVERKMYEACLAASQFMKHANPNLRCFGVTKIQNLVVQDAEMVRAIAPEIESLAKFDRHSEIRRRANRCLEGLLMTA